MYAQYNQQYQQAGGTAVSTNGMVWNGNAWVAAGSTGHFGGHSTYSTAAYTTAAPRSVAPSSTTESPAALVTKFTQYYHQWTARAQEQERRCQALPLHSAERTQLKQHVDWAKYYADQSSRAAHHYHSNPHTPAPFELPPAPPAVNQQQQQKQQQQAQQQQQPQPSYSTQQPAVTKRSAASSSSSLSSAPASAPSASSSSPSCGPPDSLKRYVHRCMEQCKTSEQKKAVERETEKVISEALQNGTLHTRNWDTVPLIRVPGASTGKRSPERKFDRTEQTHSSTSKKQKVSSSDSYYGPSTGGRGSPPAWKGGNQSGHYGPPARNGATNPSASSSSTTSQYYQPNKQQQSKYLKGNDYRVEGGHDFIAVPSAGSKKNGVKGNKYVNPNSIKHLKAVDGFQRSSETMAKRANRFSGPGGNDNVRQATAKGIEDRYMGKGVIGGSTKKLDETDYEQMKVKGTCMKLEKHYLRLTAPPKPENVRPLEILQQHLKNLKEEWKSSSRRDYPTFFCSQMKALRQDLTVQHISNAFTVDVYETHARMALEEGDLNEFNQAQTQLKILYHKLEDSQSLDNENEFVAYRMIYFIMLMLNEKYTGGSSDLLNLMLSLTPDQKEDPAIKHALQIRAAVTEIDYHKFFRLYGSCPNLGNKLMDLMVPTFRHWALQRMGKAYRPSCETVYVLKELGFPTEKASDLAEGKKYLLSCGCVLNKDGTEIITKDSVVRESDLQEKRSLI